MNLGNAVSGYSRAAASARLSLLAPRPWIFGAGVCPAPVERHVADHGTARIDRNRRTVEYLAQPSMYVSTRQFDKHHPGSTLPRPPV